MRRKSIRLQPHEDHQLKQHYLNWRVPSDQWAQRPRQFARFVAEWNAMSGRHDSPDDIRHYVITKRKAGKWVTLDGDYVPLRCPGEDDLTADEWAALRSAYVEINEGRDQYAASAELRDMLAAKFYERTGRYIAGDQLYAAIMAQQKHSRDTAWPRITSTTRPTGLGFRDIDEVA